MSVIARIRKKIKLLIGEFYARTGRISDNKIFVMTFDNKYSCNARYIVDEILRQNLPVEIVWVSDKNKSNIKSFPKQIKVVRRRSPRMYREQTSAKLLIDNALGYVWYDIPKKKGQIYINTWHGSMGIKKLQGDDDWMTYANKCKDVTDYMIANSAFEEEVYRTTFWPRTPVWKCGHARNDILFDKDNFGKIRDEVAQYFGIGADKKILLYAPTFRDDGDVSCYDIDYKKLKDALKEKYGGEWVILVRMHFKNRTGENSFENYDWIKDAVDYPDMQKLIAVADFGITDYSSWAYDYVLTRRPMILYAPDAEKYQNGRGLYYPLEETPFPVAHNNTELAKAVGDFDEDVYLSAVDRFLEARGCYEQGDAAKKIVEKIKNVMDIN